MARKNYDLRPSRDMREAGRRADADLAGSMLKLIAVGIAGGLALIAGAKKVGEGILSIQEATQERLEKEREIFKNEVRKIAAAEAGELILEPEAPPEKPESGEIVLEGEPVSDPVRELIIDGEAEAESKIAEAMSEYSDAMDKAAGVR